MIMDIRLGDILIMKKSHPCGSDQWLVLRIGADFRLRCCGRAQWEIRDLVKQMITLVDPELQFMLVPKCKSGRIICNDPCCKVD